MSVYINLYNQDRFHQFRNSWSFYVNDQRKEKAFAYNITIDFIYVICQKKVILRVGRRLYHSVLDENEILEDIKRNKKSSLFLKVEYEKA